MRSDRQTDRQIDMAQLIAAFRCTEKAPKKDKINKFPHIYRRKIIYNKTEVKRFEN